mmetsp:Transcript_23081/g.53989  ORF Transcript_23081/g.53989 Transcript_23081/m.53989 type:complete len:133 (-) Transcript_23081:62-460(-)|eukprot:CAMPEP_0114570826 /NCGR_PEP_ID=MMETSP0114-20121206/17414_1 /TAXON_ID=31324 /ORGANISM="Goniomonas sp, Strain m" /LENGTH=132 /DNA_ID=CAMNT_0001757893 /DNA_START=13 /DNA_END=411 /DNA_ORIENTATION=-
MVRVIHYGTTEVAPPVTRRGLSKRGLIVAIATTAIALVAAVVVISQMTENITELYGYPGKVEKYEWASKGQTTGAEDIKNAYQGKVESYSWASRGQTTNSEEISKAFKGKVEKYSWSQRGEKSLKKELGVFH